MKNGPYAESAHCACPVNRRLLWLFLKEEHGPCKWYSMQHRSTCMSDGPPCVCIHEQLNLEVELCMHVHTCQSTTCASWTAHTCRLVYHLHGPVANRVTICSSSLELQLIWEFSYNESQIKTWSIERLILASYKIEETLLEACIIQNEF